MTEADVWRIVNLANDLDCIVFIHLGELGTQPILMPNKVYRWRNDDATPESNAPKRRVLPPPEA